MSQLRRAVSAETTNALWQLAQSGEFPRKRACPACDQAMSEVPVQSDSGGKRLDVCVRCQFVWLDAGEFESLPKLQPAKHPWSDSDNNLSSEAREKLAIIEIEAIRKQAEDEQEYPDEPWKRVFGFLGLPVEYGALPLARAPWVTWLVAAAITLVAVLTFGNLRTAVRQYGLIPAEFARMGGLTLFTSFLLHGGMLHLLGNLYFLVVFGDNVEDDLGKWRFILLLVLSTLTGDALHILGDPRATMPCIGASGGISGIITYYALKFPHLRLGLVLGGFFAFKWVRFSALTGFLVWIGFQLFGAWTQMSGFSDVSALAHLGGAATGLFFWLHQSRRLCMTGAS